MTQMSLVDTETSDPRRGLVGRVLRRIEHVELALGGILLLMILVLVVQQVLARFTPVPSEAWSGEVAKYGLVWLTFALSGFLMGRDEHVALDVIDHVLPPRGQRIVRVFSLLTVAAVCLALTYEGLQLTSSQTGLKSPAAGIPLTWVYAVPFIGVAMTALRAVLLVFVAEARTVPTEQGSSPDHGKEAVA